MKKLLITGGSHAEIPLIRASKALGYYVITTGANADGLGHKEADEYINGDFSDKEFIYNLAKEKNVSAIISGCNDFAYLSTAYACEKLGLSGHDTFENAKIIHHKDSFRQVQKELCIKYPRAEKIQDESQLKSALKSFSLPIMVKPVDLTGGKGVSVCNTEAEVFSAFSNAAKVTREKYIIIEEYVSGSNHGASLLLKKQKVVLSVFDDEQYFKNKYLVQGASMPSSSVSQAAIFSLINDVEKIATHLKLADGLFHVQFIIDKSGYPVMIDPCRRSPGDLYTLLAKYTAGIDYPLEIVKAEVGLSLSDSYPVRHNFVARQCIMADRNGKVKDIYISEKVKKHVIYQMIWGNIGDMISDFMKYKAGILLLQFQSFEEMNDILVDFHQLVKIEVE
ncbi:MAG: ATP-grasp domain-containing protein [Treponema sp.]|nr:ATP-grasp domain-containing protein [Treponema sp.]